MLVQYHQKFETNEFLIKCFFLYFVPD